MHSPGPRVESMFCMARIDRTYSASVRRQRGPLPARELLAGHCSSGRMAFRPRRSAESCAERCDTFHLSCVIAPAQRPFSGVAAGHRASAERAPRTTCCDDAERGAHRRHDDRVPGEHGHRVRVHPPPAPRRRVARRSSISPSSTCSRTCRRSRTGPTIRSPITLAEMDRFGVEIGLVGVGDEVGRRALKEHPDRFVALGPRRPQRGHGGDSRHGARSTRSSA